MAASLCVFSPAARRHPPVSDSDQPDQRPDRASELQPQAPLRPVELTPDRIGKDPTRTASPQKKHGGASRWGWRTTNASSLNIGRLSAWVEHSASFALGLENRRRVDKPFMCFQINRHAGGGQHQRHQQRRQMEEQDSVAAYWTQTMLEFTKLYTVVSDTQAEGRGWMVLGSH